MKGLVSNVRNALNDYKSTVYIKKRDVLAAPRATVKRTSTDNSSIKLEIDNNSDAPDKENTVECLPPHGNLRQGGDREED